MTVEIDNRHLARSIRQHRLGGLSRKVTGVQPAEGNLSQLTMESNSAIKLCEFSLIGQTIVRFPVLTLTIALLLSLLLSINCCFLRPVRAAGPGRRIEHDDQKWKNAKNSATGDFEC